MKKILVSLAATLMAMTYTARVFSESVEDICIEPDHFLSYEIDAASDFFVPGILVIDEFMAEAEPTDLSSVQRLLNPAIKFHEGEITKPVHPTTHYVAVNASVTGFTFSLIQEIMVFNQFEKRTIDIPGDLLLDDEGSPAGLQLLVPSLKTACPRGDCSQPCEGSGCFPDGDYYLCYPLLPDEVDVCSTHARFNDQFQKNRLVENLVPTRFCNPVTTTVSGVTFGADRAATNHLLCYAAGQKRIDPRYVQTLNAFGEQTGVVEVNNEICVPTTSVPTEFDIP